MYDIKPYLPSDRVGDIILNRVNTSNGNSIDDETNLDGTGGDNNNIAVLVPPWVTEDDRLASVSWSAEAQESVQRQREIGALHPLYPPLDDISPATTPTNSSDWKDDDVCLAISEIVAQDPRAQYDKRGLATGTDKMYEITFCTLRVGFIVKKEVKTMSGEDGNDDNANQERKEKKKAVIIDVWPDPGDPTAIEGSYQHNLALRRREEVKALKVGKILKWTNPVREGITTGLCDHIMEYHPSMEENGSESIED